MSRKTIILVLASLAGCASQANTDYPGEALATLAGTVQTGSVTPPSSVDAAIVWAQPSFSGSPQLVSSLAWVGESTPVTGAFPAAFTLSVYQPPPSSSLITIPCLSGNAQVAVGFVVAVDSTVPITNANIGNAVVGGNNEFMLVYLDADQPAGSSCAQSLGFTFAPTKGFHLLQEVPNSIEPRFGGIQYPAYTEAQGGLATPITITLGETGFFGSGGESCYVACNNKASSCGAPSNASDVLCADFCDANPTTTQQSCLQSSSCNALEQAVSATTGGTVCGVSLPPMVQLPDAGTN